MSFDIRRPDQLQLDGNLAENWRVFKQNFDIFVIASELDEKRDEQKIAIFLNVCGPETIEVFNSLPLNANERKNYKAVVDAVENYCTPKKNEVYEAFKFNSRKQEEGETFDSYMHDLKKLVKNCGYSDADRMVRDKIVIGINNNKLRKKLLETPNLNLSKAIDIARASELVEKHANEMQKGDERTTVAAVGSKMKQNRTYQANTRNQFEKNEKLIDNNNARQINNCRFCKRSHEYRKCPAFGQRCNNCGRLNHFSIACFASKVREIQQSEDVEASETDICLHNISSSKANRKRWYEKIRVEDCLINFKLDTGADVSVLPYKYLKHIKNAELKEGGTPPQSYGGTDLNYKGTIDCVVMCRNEITVLKFTVVDTPFEPLLGLEACEKLRLIKRICVVKDSAKEEFIQANTDIFEGMGCFVENLDIKVKKNSIPIVKPARRIPLALNERVKQELDNMVKRGIIERVDGPIERASNLVIVEKKTGQLRLCIDPQDLNADILVENYTLPSFESISARLANKRYFTVLDLKEGFWQIGLSSSASELRTFNSPFGCYRFRRLPYGIKIGPEVFQKYNERNFEGIDDVIVFIDDILIAADTIEQHDKILKEVVDRARQKCINLM